MISILGRSVVLAALLLATVGAVISFAAAQRNAAGGVVRARRLAYLYAAMMALATGLMIFALVSHDFSVSYVAQVGSLATPLHITIVSLWSSLDGSILFWGLILGAFTAGSAFHLRRSAPDQVGYMLGTLFVVGIFFTFLIAGPADPFAPTPLPIPTDGPGPNPLLQNHPLMIIHPPMLYLGYVGMSVPFAIALAALFAGRLDRDWIRSLRTWLLVPTGFLTMGVMLGGWWSYEVLGWGGYWAWDPVENASFLPWLTAIAAVHSALVLQRKGTLRAWTVVLVVVTFLLTILGTFLTRSGVVNSVHSFTQTPIGPAFLAFLGFCLVASVVVLAMRMDTLASDPDRETLWTREGAFLINNLLLLVFMFTVLVGTLFPIAAELVRGVKVSVGEPYFNRMAIPISLGLLLLIGIGPALPWGHASDRNVRRALLFPLPAALAALLLTAALGGRSWGVLATGALAGYAIWVNCDQGLRLSRRRREDEPWTEAVGEAVRRGARRYGAYLAHLGVIVTFVAIAVSSSYQVAHEATMRPGESMAIAGYKLTYEKVDARQEPHRVSERALMRIERNGKDAGTLEPALNRYDSRMEPIGTPAVRTALGHDLYLSLMNVGTDGTIGMRAIVTPAVVWIWIGVFIIVFGTAICLLPAGLRFSDRRGDPLPGAEAAA
ncbi:MAG: heme lyase CcmF/NrfE family subunit [Thermoanaerobaculia bacterium]|nr:heme lyase CcmF/NrfE family subunit [Thermoanaerobaculia bacterium]